MGYKISETQKKHAENLKKLKCYLNACTVIITYLEEKTYDELNNAFHVLWHFPKYICGYHTRVQTVDCHTCEHRGLKWRLAYMQDRRKMYVSSYSPDQKCFRQKYPINNLILCTFV
jgi:hypothetical protein